MLASCAFSPRYLLILGDIDRNVHTVQLFDEGKRLPIYQQRGSRILKLLTYLYVREILRELFLILGKQFSEVISKVVVIVVDEFVILLYIFNSSTTRI